MQTARGTKAARDIEVGSGGDRLRESRGAQRPKAVVPDLLLQNTWADVAPLDDADSCSGDEGSISENLGETMRKQQPQLKFQTCHSRRLQQARGQAQQKGRAHKQS